MWVAIQDLPRSAAHPFYTRLNQILHQHAFDGYVEGQCQRYIAEPDRGRWNWKKNRTARDAVYRNRRRIRGPRGPRLLRLRGERLERPCAHLYETGGMRRVHLRGHTNIRKRLLIHASGFNLGLLMRQLIGVGKPRSAGTRRW